MPLENAAERMPGILVDYDPDWPRRFDGIAAELTRLSGGDWMVEHIGSTVIPGLRAKPVIDVAVRLVGAEDFAARLPDLEAAGWRVGSGVRTHPVMVFEVAGVRTRIAHFFAPERWEHANQRVFRDWLLAHPDDAHRYEQVKTAAARAESDGAPYNAAKTEIVQEILDRARAARGLPPVPASDKAS